MRFFVMISTSAPPRPLAMFCILPGPVPGDHALLPPLDGERSRRHIVRDHGTGTRCGVSSYLYRRDEHGIRTDARPVVDPGGVLPVPVVVHRDGPRPDVDVVA